MGTQQIILLIINILGGAAVILSYIYGLKGRRAGPMCSGETSLKASDRFILFHDTIRLDTLRFIYYILFRIDPATSSIGYYLFMPFF